MFKHIFKIFCAVILISFINIYAQNYNDALRVGFPGLGSNARALGMGNAFNALSDDASASFFNPAGFGLLKKMEVSGGLTISNYVNNTTFFGNKTQDNTTNTVFNRVSFALPFPTYQGSLVFGFSYHKSKELASVVDFNGFNNGNNSKIQSLLKTYIPYDLFLTNEGEVISPPNYTSKINGELNQSGNILNSGGIDNWTFSSAMEIYKNLFIGGNLTFYGGNFESNNDYYEDDTRGRYQDTTALHESHTIDFLTFYLNNNLKWDIAGWDFKAGFLYQVEDVARIGLTVQFPKMYKIDETFTVNGYSEFGTGYKYNLDAAYYSDKVSYDIITPFELNGSVAFNFKGLILSAEATLIDYTQLKFDNADGLSSDYIASANKEIKNTLRSVINYNFGLEYTVPKVGLRLRGGYFVQPSAFDGDASHYNHKYITGGIGYLADGTIGIDVAYAYGIWKDIGDNYLSNVSRTFQDITHHNVMLTLTYRF